MVEEAKDDFLVEKTKHELKWFKEITPWHLISFDNYLFKKHRVLWTLKTWEEI